MIVQMLKNKEVLQDTFLLSNRYDNKSTNIKINLLDEFVNENYFYYLICKSPDKNISQFAVPLALDLETKSLTYIVRSHITNTKGNWEFCLLIKEIEIVDGVINDDGLIAISEHFVGKVKSGIITEEELGEQPLEEPLQIIYDILLATNANISANEEARKVFEVFDISKSYKVGNKVSYLGSSYYCIADSSGILPTDTSKWLLIAKKGDKGDIGDTGDKGDIGDTGKGLEFSWNGTQLGVRVEGEAQYQYVDLKGEKGIQGDTGNGISSIVRTSGTGAAGTTDTYTITFTNGSTTTFQVYNGADGLGVGDMLKSVYDKDNSGQVDKADDADKLGGQQPAYYAKATDIPDISSKLDNSHNTDETAHDDIRQSINSLDANGNLKVYKTLIGEPYNQTTKTTVNCGFKPKLIIIQANILYTVYESTAYITQDGTAHYIYTSKKATGNIRALSAGNAVYFENESTANRVFATIVITETGFELTWTVQGNMETTEQRRMIVVAQA